MGNVISYLKWRGDLNFKERSFCEADNLALAMLSYENLDGIVAGTESNDSISIREAYEKYSDRSRESVLKYMARSKRYE
ncbi:MAG: beta-carotene 15,15'-monooxygenase, partial [Clostridia bacterium]|nr:beta-carotene 15,15'-monooxygenase [Clostridia bacterium]